jgi:heme/copper-type cytochrome/quinol oxidase subunit 2
MGSVFSVDSVDWQERRVRFVQYVRAEFGLVRKTIMTMTTTMIYILGYFVTFFLSAAIVRTRRDNRTLRVMRIVLVCLVWPLVPPALVAVFIYYFCRAKP